jgi:hypothetical protein
MSMLNYAITPAILETYLSFSSDNAPPASVICSGLPDEAFIFIFKPCIITEKGATKIN